jgi:hypothetical protein
MTDFQQGQDGMMRPSTRLALPSTVKRGPDTVWKDYNEIRIEDSIDERTAKLEQWIAMRVGTVLMRHYNQREWKVQVDVEAGLMIVGCDSICNFKGYHIYLDKTIDELEKRAIMAAGEILERHNISRSKRFDPDIIETLARDARDSVIAVDSVPESV